MMGRSLVLVVKCFQGCPRFRVVFAYLRCLFHLFLFWVVRWFSSGYYVFTYNCSYLGLIWGSRILSLVRVFTKLRVTG